MEQHKQYYIKEGTIGKDFYENFIKERISAKGKKLFKKALDNNDEYIEYYRVSVYDTTDRITDYSCLWFFDVGQERTYYPVYINNINSSSSMAMCMCGMDRDDNDEDNNYDDDNDDYKYYTANELLERFIDIPTYPKMVETLTKILTQTKKVEPTADELYLSFKVKQIAYLRLKTNKLITEMTANNHHNNFKRLKYNSFRYGKFIIVCDE